MQHRRLLLSSLITVSLTGCVAAPPVVPPDPPETCAHVDGRGGIDADGSAAHPFETIDEAIASLGADGGVVCLGAGELAPPTTVLATPITLRGVSAADSVITGRLGACLPALGIEDLPPTGTTHASDTVLETSADVTIERVGISGCSIGVHALSGALLLDGVAIDEVNAGVVLAAGASLVTEETSIGIARSLVGSTVAPGGVVSVGAASVNINLGTDIHGYGAALYLSGVDVVVNAAHFHDLAAGLAILDNDGHTVLVRDTLIETVTIGEFGVNAVIGGSVEMERATIRDVELFGLALDGVTSTLTSCAFSGARHLLRVQGGTADLMGETSFINGTIALAAVPSELTASAPAEVRVHGTIVSDGASIVHAFADHGAHLVLEGESNVFRGGAMGLAAYDGSAVEVTQALSVEGATIAVGGFDLGSTISVTGLVATGFELGVLTSEATTTLIGPILTGGQHALGVRSGTLDVTGGTISDATSSGVRVLTGTATLRSASIERSGGPGVSAEGGVVALDTMQITESGGVGVIAQGGTMLSVSASTFEANLGAALALYDGNVDVQTSTFLPSRAAADGRVDEIRIVADGAPATMQLNDGNAFVLTAVECPPDTCSVIMASGVGANAIVRPNCITTPDADVIQGLAQDGGAITGTTGWLAITTTASLLLDPGAFPGLPAVRANPPAPVGGFTSLGL